MTGADANLAVPVPWNKLLLWIQRQIAHEMQTGQPVALTRPQLQALSQFVPFNEEPDVSDHDYVSQLMQKMQTRHSANPVFEDQDPTNIPIDGHFQPLWRCICTIERYGSFPREGFGFSAGQQAPFFQSKKNAKQFAAKHALSFLDQVAATPIPGLHLDMDRPSISPVQLFGPQILPPQSKQPLNKRPRLSPRLPSPTPVPAAPRSSVSVFEKVASLSSRLGIDTPAYRVEPDPAGVDLFSGQPVFKNAMRVPPEVGVVSGIAGQNEARLRVAESVLDWLQAELQRRQETFERLWSSESLPAQGADT
ncbi:hypothetical protein NOR_04438 [Metarhizium rileyi]|uniref:DRBM domain-containing protein n=1 Tax=Metarhizium rileyi (strain RCEF 4871) TaxID=1649241 RepID=A0A167DYY4_METRR|nr:hypothetical protein NOR_04438 [Metarhizium rileyi RCEF 4871]